MPHIENDKQTFDSIRKLFDNHKVLTGFSIFFLVLIAARTFIEVAAPETAILHKVLSLVGGAVAVAIVVAINKLFRSDFFSDANMDEEPPMGWSPSMPGYYEENYLNREMTVNATGELIPAEESPLPYAGTGGKSQRGQKASAKSGRWKGRKKGEEQRIGPALDEDGKLPTPHELFDAMGEYVIGQEEARKVLSVAVYNHYKRITSDFQPRKDVEIAKSNLLICGESGTGKTYMVQTLARTLDVPLAIADATSLTDAGYVGEDVESVIQRLIQVAGSPEAAQFGIIYIDEIDKIARSASPMGTGRMNDPSGEGVQQGLLKLLEGHTASIGDNKGVGMFRRPAQQLDTTNILFICGGAFVGIEDIVRRRVTSSQGIGFMSATEKPKEYSDDELLDMVEPQDFYKYGFMPEFIGRIPIITRTKGLSVKALVRILTEPRNAIVKQYRELFSYEGVDLWFDEEALEAVAEAAIKRQTGARGLRSICEKVLQQAMFDLPSLDGVKKVVVHKECVTDGTEVEYIYEGDPRLEEDAKKKDKKGIKKVVGKVGDAVGDTVGKGTRPARKKPRHAKEGQDQRPAKRRTVRKEHGGRQQVARQRKPGHAGEAPDWVTGVGGEERQSAQPDGREEKVAGE